MTERVRVDGQDAGQATLEPSTRERIMVTAERLFAQRGIRSVSLREVGSAAGQRNNSATQYHFGSREGLIQAILIHRISPTNEMRSAMLDEIERSGETHDLRRLAAALVVPFVAAVPLDGTSCYARFLESVVDDAEMRRLVDPQEEFMASTHHVHRLIAAALNHLPRRLRRHRIVFANTMLIHVVAEYERAAQDGRGVRATSRGLAGELVDAIVGLWSAPASSWPISWADGR